MGAYNIKRIHKYQEQVTRLIYCGDEKIFLYFISFKRKYMQRWYSLGDWMWVKKSVLIDLTVIEAPMMPHKALCRDHERIYSSSPTDKKQC